MIRKHMDEAPILEAYEENCPCPLCHIQDACEIQYVESALGASVMEPSARVEVNEKGFCERHFKMLYDKGDRLPLALMLDTHMDSVIKRVEAIEFKKGLLHRGRTASAPTGTCAICDRLEATMARYESTLVYMYLNSADFKKTFLASKGFCLRHLNRLIEIAPADFAKDAVRLTIDYLKSVKSDVHWYTLKFDYRNTSQPWGNSQDSVYRAIGLLRGNRNIDEPKD